MTRFTTTTCNIKGLKIIKRKTIRDRRGSFSRLFCNRELSACGWHRPIAQVNHTFSRHKGTVRGMHYQLPPHCEMKLITCLKGEILDVVVDLRRDSPTFLQSHTLSLSATNNISFLIPKGFAHGFQTMTDNVELLYFHSTFYNKEAERGLNPEDPKLGLNWPIQVKFLSRRDSSQPFINDDFQGINL